MNAERKAVILAVGLGLLACLIHGLTAVYIFGESGSQTSLREVLLPLHDTGRAFYNIVTLLFFSVYGFVTARALGQRRRAQDALRRSRAELAEIFETAAEAIIEVDLAGQILRVNQAAAQLTGFSVPEMLGRRCDELIASEFCHTPDCPLQRVLRGEPLHNVEMVYERKDGGQRVCLLSARALLDEAGDITGALANLRDITELRATEIQYRTLVNTTLDAVMILSFEGEITYVNAALGFILGREVETLQVRNIADLLAAEQLAIVQEQLALCRQGQSVQYEVKYRHSDGHEVPILVSASPFHDASGNLVGSFAVMKDISSIRQAEQQTAHLNSVLLAVRNVNQLITREQDRDQLLQEACVCLIETRGYACAGVVLVDEQDDPLQIFAASLEAETADSIATLKETGWWRRLPCSSTEAQVISQIDDCPLSDSNAGDFVGLGIRLQYAERQYGALLVTIPAAMAHSADELSLFEEVAGDLAFALHAGEIQAERENYQTEVLREKERSDRIINTAGALIVGLAPEGRITLFNEQCERTTGFQAAEIIGRKLWEGLLPQRYISRVKAVFDELASQNQPNSYENPWLTREGRERLISWRNTPILDAEGNVREIIAIGLDITEHRATELAIRESEQRHRLLFNSIADAVFVFELLADGMPGQFLAVNDSACTIFGYSREELLKLSPRDLDAPEELPEVQALMRRLLEEEHIIFEQEHLTREGRVLPTEVSAHLLQYEGRTAVLSIARDITERRQAQQDLLASEILYATTVDALEEWIHVVDADLQIIMVNGALLEVCRQLGQPSFRNSMGLEEWFPFLTEQILDQYRQVLTTGKPIHDTHSQVICGRRFVTENSRVPVFEGSQVVRIVTVMRDVTARVQAEEEWQRLNRRYELLADSQVVGTFILQDDQIVFANRSLHEKLGYDEGELVGGHPLEAVVAEERDKVVACWRSLAAGDYPWLDFETQLMTRTGERLWVHIWAQDTGIFDGAKTLIGHVVDITETRELRLQLEHSQRLEALGTLAGGVAHEFNNLLQAIMMNASLLQMNMEVGSSDRDRVGSIIERTEHGATLTEQLLAFSRRTTVTTEPVDLNALIEDTCRMLHRTLQHQIVVETALDCDVPNLNGDPARLKQVLVNLALNARDAMPEGGVLSFCTACVEVDEVLSRQVPGLGRREYVVLSVSDTGQGMDEATAARVFEPFFTTKQVSKGTGLGLSIVHGIVEAHGGVVRLETHPGQGTRFDIYLPLGEVSQEAKVESRVKEEETGGGTETVLIVDDEVEVLQIAREALEYYGYRVLTATDGFEALALFEQHPQDVDLVILDLIMPGMSGQEVLTQLLRRRPALPVMIASGYTPVHQDQEGEGVLANRYLSKPYSLHELLEAVRCLLDEAKGEEKGL